MLKLMNKLTHKEIEEFLLNFPDSWLDFPFGESASVYKYGHQDGQGKIFAIVANESDPLRLSLKCDPKLAKVLRERYETVLPGYHLNKKHWNTIICSGQLNRQEIEDLINLSYNLVSSS